MAVVPRRPAVDRFIDAAPDAVWRVLTDLSAWPSWGPSVRGAELTNGGSTLSAGSRGVVWTVLGARLPFAVTRWEDGRRWDWTVAGVPATGHEVVPEGIGCRVRFEAPWWAVGYLPVCAVALRRIEQMAGGRAGD